MLHAWTGLALGLVGSAEIVLGLIGSQIVATICMLSSLIIWLGFTAHRLCHPGLIFNEFSSSPAALCSWGVWQMTFLLQWNRWMPAWEKEVHHGVIVGVWLGFIFQLIIMACFLRISSRLYLSPEPIFFPPTVDAAITAIVGINYGSTGITLALCSLWLALLAVLCILPPCLYYILQNDNIARNPSIGILQAPVSLLCHAFNACRQRRVIIASSQIDNAIHLALFGLSALLFHLTAWATWRRRNVIFARLNLSWSAFTFPFCATAIASLEVAAQANSSTSAFVKGFVHYYATSIAVLALSVVAFVILIIVAQSCGFINDERQLSAVLDDDDDLDFHLHEALFSLEGFGDGKTPKKLSSSSIANEKTTLMFSA